MPTVEAPEIELVDLTEEQTDEPCVIFDDCPLAADWSLTCRSCGQYWPACDPHYQKTNAKVELGDWFPKCAACNAKGAHLVDVFIVIRTRRS